MPKSHDRSVDIRRPIQQVGHLLAWVVRTGRGAVVSDWIGPGEASKILRVSKAWVHRLIAKGRLTPTMVSARVLVLDRSEVGAYWRNRLVALAGVVAERRPKYRQAWNEIRGILPRLTPADLAKARKDSLQPYAWDQDERNPEGGKVSDAQRKNMTELWRHIADLAAGDP